MAAAEGAVGAGARGGDDRGPIQPVVVARRKGTMRSYGPHFTNPHIDAPTLHAPVYGHTECKIYFGDQDASGDSHNLAFHLNFDAGQAEIATSDEARVAHFIGCIINIFPGRREEILHLAADGGYKFTVVRVPSGIAEAGLVMPDHRMHPAKQRAIFGYLVIMLFKQINENSYQNFTSNRLRALFAVAAYEVKEGEDVTVFNDIFHAKTYRTVFGQNFGLRKKIAQCVIEKQTFTGILGSVCAYVSNILSWSEMTNLNFIMETLLITKSPVLLQPELATEVLNVERAIKAVRACAMPQFFRVLQPPHETAVLARNNFPRLAAIAAKIKGSGETNASQFVTTMNTNDNKLEEYLKLHNAGMIGNEPGTVHHALSYLTNFDKEEEED